MNFRQVALVSTLYFTVNFFSSVYITLILMFILFVHFTDSAISYYSFRLNNISILVSDSLLDSLTTHSYMFSSIILFTKAYCLSLTKYICVPIQTKFSSTFYSSYTISSSSSYSSYFYSFTTYSGGTKFDFDISSESSIGLLIGGSTDKFFFILFKMSLCFIKVSSILLPRNTVILDVFYLSFFLPPSSLNPVFFVGLSTSKPSMKLITGTSSSYLVHFHIFLVCLGIISSYSF